LNNGIGLTRLLLDDWTRLRRRLPSTPHQLGRITLVCGKLIAPTLEGLAQQLSSTAGVTVRLIAVENAFFGPTVTVSGLLTWGDVKNALTGQDLGRLLVLPSVMFDAGGQRTLDDVSLEEIRASLGVPVTTADCLSGLAGPAGS
jgi:NifB/MoaA-like Fe-S oxidoreductase